MNQNSTRTFSWYGRPGWRGLSAGLTIVIALVLMTGVVFAQPDSSPFATPDSALAASLGAGTGSSIQVAANPSMNVAQWYAPGVVANSDHSFFAKNPETMVASRYAAGMAASSDGSTFALNPELMLVQNWEASRAAVEAQDQLCTPEDYVC